MAFEAYLDEARRALIRLGAESAPAIEAAAALTANALEAGGVLHVFGSGHSHLLAEEAFYRAGGLAPVNPIFDRRLMFLDGVMESTRAEREPGLAARILEREDVRSVDVAVVVSSSGTNNVPVEMALGLQARGLKVVAITGLAHSRAASARHASGRKLYQIADVVIDTGIPEGDAAVVLPGTSIRMGPLSTIVGAAIVHSLLIEAATRLLERGHHPPVLSSVNLETTRVAAQEELLARYAGRIRYLDVGTT